MHKDQSTATTVLQVRDLSLDFVQRKGPVRALYNIDLEVSEGEILGLIGESGAGKSLLGSTIIKLLPSHARVASGEVLYAGQNILALDEKAQRAVRGKNIAMIFQDPQTSLNPLLTIGYQLIETIQTHLGLDKKAAHARAIALLNEVGIPSPEARMKAYPHEFSGGQRQRIVIAIAISAEPKVIIADEPTTALDVSVQAQILVLLRKLCDARKTAIIFITHDMGVLSKIADRVAVLYAGSVVECGMRDQIIFSPRHPYSKALMDSIPRMNVGVKRLQQIEGNMPRIGELGRGCPFAPRCERAQERCSNELPRMRAGVACWNPWEPDHGAQAQSPAKQQVVSEEKVTSRALSESIEDEEKAFLARFADTPGQE